MAALNASQKSMDFKKTLWTAHVRLANFNRTRLEPQIPSARWRQTLNEDVAVIKLESEVLEFERVQILRLAKAAPEHPIHFMEWFEELRTCGPGQNDPLFDWLRDTASRAQMKWFIQQEVAGEAGFEDLTALTQVKMPVGVKLEMARNYWDEMGRGQEHGMHGPMLERLVQEFDLHFAEPAEIVPESLALANVMMGLALHRRYAYHSIGALGAIEMTAPDRALRVYQGLKRLGVSVEGQRYFLLHSALDKKHSESWNREVIAPLVQANPHLAIPIAEGALMRLHCGARCFERYRQELWGSPAPNALTTSLAPAPTN